MTYPSIKVLSLGIDKLCQHNLRCLKKREHNAGIIGKKFSLGNGRYICALIRNFDHVHGQVCAKHKLNM